jgi:hypothetical protein
LSVSHELYDKYITEWWNWAHSKPGQGPQQPEKMDSIVFIPPVWHKEHNPRQITIRAANTPIFIPVYNVVTSKKLFNDNNPSNDAKKDIDDDVNTLSLKIDNVNIPLNNTYRPNEPIKFEFNGKENVNGSGKGKDENAYADGYHVVHPGFSPGTTHTIEVNKVPPGGPISVTWIVTVPP